MPSRIWRELLWPGLVAVLLGQTGCSGIAKGVTEAILEKAEQEDTRICHVEGPASQGLASLLEAQTSSAGMARSSRSLKILMIHGIGTHIPGYSARLTEHLMQALKLDVRNEVTKEFSLRDPGVIDGPLGTLRVSQFTNKARSQEIVFYELTWSEITEEEKKVLAFDDSTEFTFRRTPLNSFMKSFLNSHISDPLIYLGNSQQAIHASVQQSFCWMTTGDWPDYPRTSNQTCDVTDPSRDNYLAENDYAVVTHSLGSRIIIDVLQQIGNWAARQSNPELMDMRQVMQHTRFPIFMLANQLPLLELGREPVAVSGQIDDYCLPGGAKAEQRLFDELAVYAFSDPNDILSYPVPPGFVEKYMDSRLCPRVTNVAINVSYPVSLFGITDVANPLEAHVGYDHDDRVIELMAHGIGHTDQSPLIAERCTWVETTRDDDRQATAIQ